jgi:hypothetical protein
MNAFLVTTSGARRSITASLRQGQKAFLFAFLPVVARLCQRQICVRIAKKCALSLLGEIKELRVSNCSLT